MKMRKVKQMPTIAPAKPKAKGTYKLQGFDSVHSFMDACQQNGYSVHSFPYNRGDERYVIVTVQAKTNMPVISWHVLDEYETNEIASGISLERDHFDLYSDIDRELRKIS